MNTPSTPLPSGPAVLPDCVELGVWTKIPIPPPDSLMRKLKEVDEQESQAIRQRGVMTFHAVGCTGCHSDQHATTQVATAMATQAAHPHSFGGTSGATSASFLYHLGDVAYKKDKDTVGEQSPPPEKHHDFAELYETQFYGPFAPYAPPVFAIAGNHDGKDQDPEGPHRKSAIHHFLKNFCGLQDGEGSDNTSSNRQPVAQPYPYWLLRTPFAYFIGLYANVNNAGQLDNPVEEARPQYDWLVKTLVEINKAADGRALFLAVHYPPYSAAATFTERGDPNLGPTPRTPGKTLEPLGVLLQRAFRDSGKYPDVVLSAHAHHYQRLTYTRANGQQIPYLIVGGGGHSPVEKLSKPCAKGQEAPAAGSPPQPVYPDGSRPPKGDRVELAAFNDADFGFLRITLDQNKRVVTGEYFRALTADATSAPTLGDSFTLDLSSHTVR